MYVNVCISGVISKSPVVVGEFNRQVRMSLHLH